MFGVSSTNSGASLISPIRRASFVQSSSESWPERSTCNGTRASADSSRMTISTLLISSEKMALAKLCFTDVARQKSMAAVELCVGIMARLARYRWSSLSTVTHRTGTLGTARTSTMNRDPVRTLVCPRRRSLCAIRLRSNRNTSSTVEKLMMYAVDVAGLRPLTRFLATVQRYPRPVINSRTSSASRHEVEQYWTLPVGATVPSVSNRPASRVRRCASDARRYTAGMCLSPSTSRVRSHPVTDPSRRAGVATPLSIHPGGGTGSDTKRARPPRDWPHALALTDFGWNDRPHTTQACAGIAGGSGGNRVYT